MSKLKMIYDSVDNMLLKYFLNYNLPVLLSDFLLSILKEFAAGFRRRNRQVFVCASYSVDDKINNFVLLLSNLPYILRLDDLHILLL